MRIRKDAKIEKLIDPHGSPLTRLQLARESEDFGVLVATNGRGMAVMHVGMDGADTDGGVPAEALALARRETGKDDEQTEVTAKEEGVIVRWDEDKREAVFSRGLPESFPDYTAIEKQMVTPTSCVSIDARQLLALAQAIGSHIVTLEIFGPKDTIRVRGYQGKDIKAGGDVVFAALAPCKPDDEK